MKRALVNLKNTPVLSAWIFVTSGKIKKSMSLPRVALTNILLGRSKRFIGDWKGTLPQSLVHAVIVEPDALSFDLAPLLHDETPRLKKRPGGFAGFDEECREAKGARRLFQRVVERRACAAGVGVEAVDVAVPLQFNETGHGAAIRDENQPSVGFAVREHLRPWRGGPCGALGGGVMRCGGPVDRRVKDLGKRRGVVRPVAPDADQLISPACVIAASIAARVSSASGMSGRRTSSSMRPSLAMPYLAPATPGSMNTARWSGIRRS